MDVLRKHLPASAERYMERYLQGIEFPIRKEELVSRLEANGVPGAVVSQVRKRLPEGEYRGPKDVLRPAPSLEAGQHYTDHRSLPDREALASSRLRGASTRPTGSRQRLANLT